jgi:hypothetical protein
VIFEKELVCRYGSRVSLQSIGVKCKKSCSVC